MYALLMDLQAIYWIALGVGAAFLLFSVVLGDVFDFLDFLDFDLGDGFSLTPVLFTALAAFGGGGLLGLEAFDLSTGGSVIAGLAAGLVAGGAAGALFALLHRQEAREAFSTAHLVGARGRCTLAITPGREGRVAVKHGGMTRTLTATSAHQIAAGEDVVVLDVLGNALKVGPAEAGSSAT